LRKLKILIGTIRVILFGFLIQSFECWSLQDFCKFETFIIVESTFQMTLSECLQADSAL